MNTITLDGLRDIADQFHHIAARVEKLLADAERGDISPRNATIRLNRILVDAEDFAQVKQEPIEP